MIVEEAASILDKMLRKEYTNIQAVGIRGNNTEAYDANPAIFAERITEDSLIVYTTTNPVPKQLALVESNGFKVAWRRTGEFVTSIR